MGSVSSETEEAATLAGLPALAAQDAADLLCRERTLLQQSGGGGVAATRPGPHQITGPISDSRPFQPKKLSTRTSG